MTGKVEIGICVGGGEPSVDFGNAQVTIMDVLEYGDGGVAADRGGGERGGRGRAGLELVGVARVGVMKVGVRRVGRVERVGGRRGGLHGERERWR